MDRAFWQARLDKKKALLIVLDDAATAISAGAIESYKLDTGQTVTWVQKSNIEVLNKVIESLENQIAVLETRLTGCGVVNARPAW